VFATRANACRLTTWLSSSVVLFVEKLVSYDLRRPELSSNALAPSVKAFIRHGCIAEHGVEQLELVGRVLGEVRLLLALEQHHGLHLRRRVKQLGGQLRAVLAQRLPALTQCASVFQPLGLPVGREVDAAHSAQGVRDRVQLAVQAAGLLQDLAAAYEARDQLLAAEAAQEVEQAEGLPQELVQNGHGHDV
jgi:hypothetical protein